MIEFIVRARKAPTDPDRFLGSGGQAVHVDYLSQILVNGLFVSKGHRRDVRLTFVLEGSADFSRIVSFDGSALGSIEDQSERGLTELFGQCLRVSVGMAKDTEKLVLPGISVRASSFDFLLKQYRDTRPIYLLGPKGEDVRSAELPPNAVFVLTDHIPMPTKQAKSLVNRGAQLLSLGPVMLHASQCVVLVQNEYDRRA